MTPAGQMVGACLSALTSSLFGRKGTIICCALFSCLGWVGLAILGSISDPNRLSAARMSAAVLCCRASVGLSMGLSGATHPMYVFELCGAAHRWKGALNATGPVCITLGVLISYVAGAYAGWKAASIGVAVVPFVGSLLLVCVPESPVWLSSRRRFDEAREVLERTGRTDLEWIDEATFFKWNLLSLTMQLGLTYDC